MSVEQHHHGKMLSCGFKVIFLFRFQTHTNLNFSQQAHATLQLKKKRVFGATWSNYLPHLNLI